MPEFRVVKSLMVETGTYNSMFNRVYESTVRDSKIIDDFIDITEGGMELDPVNLAGLSGKVVRPSAVPHGELFIENGFHERRIVFMFAVEHNSAISKNPKLTIVSGYTDRVDISLEGSVAPDLKMYINSITQVNTMGQPKPVAMDQVLSANMYDNFGINEDQQFSHYDNISLHLMRPMDVIRNIEFLHDSDINMIDGNNTIVPSRNFTSRRANGLSSRYLSSIVSSIISADTHDIFSDDIRDARYGKARSSVKETTLLRDSFAKELKMYSTFKQDGYVTYADLNHMCPNFDLETKVVMMKQSPNLLDRASQSGDSQDWGDSSHSTVAATIVSQSMGAIMTQCLLTYIDCTFSNETSDGIPFLEIENMAGFGDFIDPRAQAKHVEFLILHELLPILTFDMEFDITVRVQFDLTLDAHISISWDGGPWERYVTPCFCDSILSPILTNNADTIMDMTRNTSAFVDAIINS